MFEKYQGVIELDKVLKKEYNYDYDGNLSKLYRQRFVELEGNGVDAIYWLSVNNERFLLKNLKDFNTDVWGELLSEEVAKRLNLPCAEYRVARLGAWEGIITKDFLAKDETLILGSEIFQRFLNSTLETEEQMLSHSLPKEIKNQDSYEQTKYIFTYLNNFEESSKIISTSKYLTVPEKDNITSFQLKRLLFDLITLQWDRHPNNWGIVKTENGYTPSPLFDNSTSFGLGLPSIEKTMIEFRQEHLNYRFFKDDERIKTIIYRGNPRFAFSKEDIKDIIKKEKLPGDKVFEHLLNKVDSNTVEEISLLLSNLDENFIEEVINTVEEKNGITMDSTVYYYISNMFQENIKYLKQIVSVYQRSSSSNHEKSR